jgi:glycosyltransferase involved in cell wall biosynthesis
VPFFLSRLSFTLLSVRILYISSARDFGGGERHLVDLSREMIRRGHEVFVGLRPTNQWQDRLDFVPRENFFYVSIRNSFGMFSAKRIARFIEKNSIDVLHAHVARDYLAASVACRISGRAKFILTRHVMFPLKPFHKFALRNVDAAIAVSSGVKLQLGKTFSDKIVSLIPNGIDAIGPTDEERQTRGREFREFHSIPLDVPIVATLGELRVLKGQRDFVLAANEIIKRFPACRFVIAGKDNSIDHKFRRELKRLVKILGHEERFVWLDWLADISPLLYAADIFVSPSHSESFSLAILDAMAAGTPVIATATDGAKELLKGTNALAPIKDPLALADKVCEFLDDPERRHFLGSQLQARAVENYGLTAMADATEVVYQKVCRLVAEART